MTLQHVIMTFVEHVSIQAVLQSWAFLWSDVKYFG
jgi:hypothetical protein